MGHGYYFYETPDYDNCVGKVWWATKFSGSLMSAVAVTDIIFMTRPRTWEYCSTRFFRFVYPFTASCALAASVSCTVANLRGKKDDCYNHIAGGLATTVIYTGFLKNSGKGVALGVLSAFAYGMFKRCHQEQWMIWPDWVTNEGEVAGMHGGENWGNLTFPRLNWDDPGRRPW